MDNFAELSVEEYVFEQVDPYLLIDMADRFPYWNTCENFVTTNLQRKLKTLSEKQKSWLFKIKRDLESELFGK